MSTNDKINWFFVFFIMFSFGMIIYSVSGTIVKNRPHYEYQIKCSSGFESNWSRLTHINENGIVLSDIKSYTTLPGESCERSKRIIDTE